MDSTDAAPESTTFSTPGAQHLVIVVSGVPLSTPPQAVPILDLDTSMMTQLIASERSFQRTNQVLFGTNISILFIAALFVAYRYFKKVQSRTAKPIASDSDGYDILHPINEARVVDDGFHDVSWISEESPSLVAARNTPHHGPWVWRTRGGDRSMEAAEEGKPSSTPNNLPSLTSSHWHGLPEQGQNTLSNVSALTKASNQNNIGSVEARPSFSIEVEPRKSTPLENNDPLGNGDRRSLERTPPAPNSTQTTNHNVGSIPTLPFNLQTSENGKEGTATPTTSNSPARHGGLREPFPLVPVRSRTGLGTAPPSSFAGFDNQGTEQRAGISRSTTTSSDVSSVLSLPSIRQYFDNFAERSTSPTPSSPSSTYGHDLLRGSIPPVQALSDTGGVATPHPLRDEGGRTKSMLSRTSAGGDQRTERQKRIPRLTSIRTSTMHSTWSDDGSIPALPSYRRSVGNGEEGNATPTPSSPPSIYGHDRLRASRVPALPGVASVAASPLAVEEGRTTPTANVPLDGDGRRSTVRAQSLPAFTRSPATSDAMREPFQVPNDSQN